MILSQLAASALNPLSPRAKLLIGVGVALLFILGIVLLVLALRRRRRSQLTLIQTEIKASRLIQIWERFLKPFSLRARWTIRTYPWAVVFGETGSGKTSLITRKVDWQSQTNQLLPSYTQDSALQIFLGSKVLVEELSPALLADASKTGIGALERLWRPLASRQSPTAVLVLSARYLAQATPAQVQRHSQLVRGKLNVLMQLIGGPIRTRVCLTFMDHAPGFAAFAELLSKVGVPLHLNLGEIEPTKEALAQAFSAYERYTPLTLTRMQAADFRATINFLDAAPTILGQAADYLRVISEEVAFSPTPQLERLYFFGQGHETGGGNPFLVKGARPLIRVGTLQRLGVRDRLRVLLGLVSTGIGRHLVICAAVAALVLISCGVIYRRHIHKIDGAEDQIGVFEGAIQRAQHSLNLPAESHAVRVAALAAGDQLEKIEIAERILPFIGDMAIERKQQLRQRYLDGIRRAYLLPAVERYKGPAARDRLVYSLGALYAASNNSLGAMVQAGIGDWASAIPIPEAVLLKYVRLSTNTWPEPVLVTLPPSTTAGQSPLDSLEPWSQYLNALNETFQSQGLSRAQLQKLQLVTQRFAEALVQVQRNQATERVVRTLSEQSPLDIKKLFGPSLSALLPPRWLLDNAATLAQLFQLIVNTPLAAERPDQLNLSELVTMLTQNPLEAAKRQQPSEQIFTFDLNGKSYKFSSRRWQELLMRGRRADLLGAMAGIASPGGKRESGEEKSPGRRRRSKRARHAAQVVESSKDEPPAEAPSKSAKRGAEEGVIQPIDREPTSSQTLLPLYTKASFEQEVKPSLLEGEQKLVSAGLSANERELFSRFLLGRSQRYARNYRNANLAYILGYKPQEGGLAAVITMLTDLLQPNSPLLTRLRTVGENVALGELPGPYLRPMLDENLILQPVVRLSAGKDGVYPEYEKYKLIIAAMLHTLDGSAQELTPAMPMSGGGDKEKKAAPPPLFGDALPPAGRLALSILQGAESSPLKQVEAFLDKAGVSGDLRRPFLLPVQRVYRLGLRDLEHAVQSGWQKERAETLVPLLGRFPFSRRVEREIAADDLESLKPPDGRFWRFVRGYVAPLCAEREGGVLVPLPNRLGGLALPRDLLPTIQSIGRLSRTLWNKDGTRQPISLVIKPLPLPALPPGGAAVTRSFFMCNGASVQGMNQLPTPHKLQIPWWQQENAAVGVDIGEAGSSSRQHLSIDVSGSQWSCYRLIDKAVLIEKSAHWRVPNPAGPELPVRFEFGEDPFAVFGLKSRAGAERAAEDEGGGREAAP